MIFCAKGKAQDGDVTRTNLSLMMCNKHKKEKKNTWLVFRVMNIVVFGEIHTHNIFITNKFDKKRNMKSKFTGSFPSSIISYIM